MIYCYQLVWSRGGPPVIKLWGDCRVAGNLITMVKLPSFHYFMQHFIADTSMKSVSSQTPTTALAGILIFLLVPSVLDLPLLVKHSEVKFSQICSGRSRNKSQGFWWLQVFFSSVNSTSSCWQSLLIFDKKETQWKELNGKYIHIYGYLWLYHLCLYLVPNLRGIEKAQKQKCMQDWNSEC